MTDLVAAPAAFKALVARYAPAPINSPQDDWSLPPTPDHVKRMIWSPNSDLRTYRQPNIEALKAAAHNIALGCGDRPGWYDMTMAIAGDIARWSDMSSELCEVFHLISREAPRYDKYGRGAYPHDANQAELEAAVIQAEKRLSKGEPIRTTASLLPMAGDNDNNDTAHTATITAPLVSTAQPIPGASYGSCTAGTLYKRKPIFSTFLYIGEITLLSSTGGAAKSTWATSVAASLAAGQPVFGFDVRQRRVLSINLEDSIGEVALRFTAAERQHGLSRAALRSNLHLIGSEDAHLFTLVESDGRGGNHIREAGFDELRRVVQHHRAELVILDPLVLLLSGGQNDGNLVGQVQRKLKALANELDFAVLMVAHTRKGSNALTDGADATAGSGALTNLARVGLGIVNIDNKRAQTLGIMPSEEWRYREVVNTKANLAPLQAGSFFEVVSVGMGNGTPDFPEEDKVAVAVSYTLPTAGASRFTQNLERDVLAAVAQGIDGTPLSPTTKGIRAHHTACIAAVASHHPSKTRGELEAIAKAVVADLLEKRWIEPFDTSTNKASGGKNPAKGLRVCWQRTPWASEPQPGPFVL